MRHYVGDNKKYISVTSILNLMSPFNRDGFNSWAYSHGLDPKWILDESHRIGTMVHNWIEDAHLGIQMFDVRERKDEIGYREAVNRFLEKYGDKFEAAEKIVKCDEFRYMGSIDSIVSGTILDYKTWGAWNRSESISSDKIRKVKYQTSMYNYAEKIKYKQAVIYFKPDGTYQWISLDYSDKPIKWLKENKELIIQKLNEEADNIIEF